MIEDKTQEGAGLVIPSAAVSDVSLAAAYERTSAVPPAAAEGEVVETPEEGGIDPNDPKIKRLSEDIDVRVSWFIQQLHKLAEDSGVQAEVLFKIIIKPRSSEG